MNDEIKEILNEMKDICNVWVKVGGDMKSYNQDQMHCIYDYITNLQHTEDLYNQLLKDYDELQQRIEKAVEYIKDMGCFDNECNYFCDDLSPNELDYLLDILKGEEIKNG